MNDTFMNKSCVQFAADLGAKTSAPGGGAATAYVGSLAAALGSMVGRFTAARQEDDGDLDEILDQVHCAQQRLIELADEDAQGFAPLSRAFKMPKDDPSRPKAIEEGAKRALQPPLAVMEAVAVAVEALEALEGRCTPLLRPDIGCGGAFAHAALQAAAINVLVNERILQDRTFAAHIVSQVDDLLAFAPRAQSLADNAAAALRSPR